MTRFYVDKTEQRVVDLVRNVKDSRKVLVDTGNNCTVDPCLLLDSLCRDIPIGTITTIPWYSPGVEYFPEKDVNQKIVDPTPQSDLVIDGVQRLEICYRTLWDPTCNMCYNVQNNMFEICTDPADHQVRTFEFRDAPSFFNLLARRPYNRQEQENLEIVRSSILLAPVAVHRISGVSCTEEVLEIRRRLNL